LVLILPSRLTMCLSGQTPTGAKLQELFDRYIPLLEDQRLAHKPISIVVITDGVPSPFNS